MPKFYAYGNSQNLVTTETLDEIIKNAGIDMTRFQVFPAYNGDSSNFANLRQIQIKGKLKPNEKLAFNINLQVSGLTDQDLYNNSLTTLVLGFSIVMGILQVQQPHILDLLTRLNHQLIAMLST